MREFERGMLRAMSAQGIGEFIPPPAPTEMYHAAPRHMRESILQHGLDHSKGQRVWMDDEDEEGNAVDPYPAGNYLYHDYDDAYWQGRTYEMPMEDRGQFDLGHDWDEADLWKVNTDGLNLTQDPRHPQAMYHPEPITPDRLSLVPENWREWEGVYPE